MEDSKIHQAGRIAASSSAAAVLAAESNSQSNPAAAQFLALIQDLISGTTPQAPQIDLRQLVAAVQPAPVKDEQPVEVEAEPVESDEPAVEDSTDTDEDDQPREAAAKPAEKESTSPAAAAVQAGATVQAKAEAPVEETAAEPVASEDLAALQAQYQAIQNRSAQNNAAQPQAVQTQAAPVVATKAAEVQAAPAAVHAETAEAAVTAQPAAQAAAPAAQAAAPAEVKGGIAAKAKQLTADDVEKYYRSVEEPVSAQGTIEARPLVGPTQAAEQGAAAKLPAAAAQAFDAQAQSLKNQIKIENGEFQSGMGQASRIDGAVRAGDAAGADLLAARGQSRAAKAVEKMLGANSANLVEKIKQLLQNATDSQTGNSLTLKFDPPELGQMTMKVTQRADQVFARITPESKEVEAVVRENAHQIISMFVANGVKAENVHLTIGEERSAGAFLGAQVSADSSGMGGEAEYRGAAMAERLFEPAMPNVEPAAIAAPAAVETGWVA